MKIEAYKVKEWCDKNLSPVAWQRIVVKVSPEFRGSGLTIKDLTNPEKSIQLDDAQYEVIKNAIQVTYEVEMFIQV